MTAQTADAVMWSPDTFRQRTADHFIEDVLNLPDDAPRVIVSRGTETRDRLVRPAELAAAGIPHYWRIEQNPVHVFAYDLVGSPHEPVADSTEEVVLNTPFAIKLPIRDIAP
jgi:hypothetical protein